MKFGWRKPWPEHYSAPNQCAGTGIRWDTDTPVLRGAEYACDCQHCAGHYWTCCHECGRDGDRAGDTNSPNLCD